jgi:chromosome segregation ATPase
MSLSNGITQEQVFEVANRILASGQAPTYKSVREELKTGSFTTLSNHLSQWKKLKSEQALIPQPSIEFHSSVLKIWNSAYREAERVFENRKREFETELDKWKEEKAELLSVIQKLEQEREVQLARDSQIQVQIAQMGHQLRQTEDQLTQSRTQLEGIETRRLEAVERADRIEAQLTRLASGTKQQEGGSMKATPL